VIYKKYIKRIIDIVFSLIVLIITSPISLIAGALLAFQNRGPVLFYQKRPGYREKAFDIVKFKTMTDEKDEQGNFLSDKERITTLGSWMRKFSIDELPQLFNVLKGDMSMIGPRPLLFKYLPLYNDEQRKRHQVKPGITGWAQVNGRNTISWERKFELDIYYVDHLSFSLDLKICWLTILKILKREGVNQSGNTTMQPYEGNN